MKTFKQFMEEFRYLPKAKMDRKIKDRKENGEGNTDKTQKMKLVRSVLGKNTNLSSSDINRNASNAASMFNKRTKNIDSTPKKAKHYVDITVKTSKKQKEIIKTRNLESNKKNPTEYDKLKREYELTKQAVKNRSETDSKRIINAKKRLEKSYSNSLDEEIMFEDYSDAIQTLTDIENSCLRVLKRFNENPRFQNLIEVIL